jgi:hypothetical protein
MALLHRFLFSLIDRKSIDEKPLMHHPNHPNCRVEIEQLHRRNTKKWFPSSGNQHAGLAG